MGAMEDLFGIFSGLKPFVLSDAQKEQLEQFNALVLEWNQKLNLTAITDPKEFWIKHIYDSLTCLQVIFAFGRSSVIDIGTGAGFPGIPLKIAYPEMCLTLAESVKKKADFCQLAVDSLGLQDVRVAAERAETLGQDAAFREKYDWAIARAVAPLAVLVEYLLPLVHTGGHVLAQKGGNAEAEINDAQRAIRLLGGEVSRVIPIELPEGMGSRTLITIKKIRPTPAAYPRRAGTPKKNPLS
jgi:16S rRNA (guanine527-N7)-methyltransferase